MTSTDLAPYAGQIERTAPLLPMDVAAAEQAMAAYQELCARVLDPSDWIGRPGEPESFVKRSGWQKLATFYGVSTELVADHVLERDPNGQLLRASARARAVARDGRHADGSGACGRNEPRFANARGRQKIEHDLPATAETRAMNRAVSNLIGFGAVSAEEVDDDVRAGRAGADWPTWASDIPEDAFERLGRNLERIFERLGHPLPEVAALDVGNTITNACGGIFPGACAHVVHLIAQAVPTIEAEVDVPEAETTETEPEAPGDEPTPDATTTDGETTT